jgi:Flp pilus assembly pilin Flp
MAKQKISIVGAIVVVGLVAFVMLLGNGTFKNFSVQSNTSPTPSPSPTASPSANSPQGILQQIQTWLSSLWNQIKAFLQGFGIKI